MSKPVRHSLFAIRRLLSTIRYPLPAIRYSPILVLLLAASLRLSGLDWDGGLAAHPDERAILSAAGELARLPLVEWDPYRVDPDYAYGHLPLLLAALLVRCAPYGDPLFAARALSALFDVGSVALVIALGRRLFGREVGLLAGAFSALAMLQVQQAHFFTVDTPLTFFVLGALLWATRLAGRGRAWDAVVAGVWAGLALSTKVSALLLALPLVLACAFAGASALPHPRRARSVLCAVLCAGAALLTFALTGPYALLELPTFAHNATLQAAMARGTLDLPYTVQYHGTWPYLYPAWQLLAWGLGWPLGLVALAGLGYVLVHAVRCPPLPAEWPLLAWVLPFLAFTGSLYAKFPRYLLPVLPLLLIYAARGVSDVLDAVRLSGRSLFRRAARTLRIAVPAGLLLCQAVFVLALVASYTAPHPWVAASRWLYDHTSPGATLAVEAWDHPLPAPVDGHDPSGLTVVTLPVFDADSLAKLTALREGLSGADYLILSSPRGYGAITRWPGRYPLTTGYYRQLFDGELGFVPVAAFARYPRLGPLAWVDDPVAASGLPTPDALRAQVPPGIRVPLGPLDESLAVYDRPAVVIFARAPGFEGGNLP